MEKTLLKLLSQGYSPYEVNSALHHNLNNKIDVTPTLPEQPKQPKQNMPLSKNGEFSFYNITTKVLFI